MFSTKKSVAVTFTCRLYSKVDHRISGVRYTVATELHMGAAMQEDAGNFQNKERFAEF